jgi:uncharacterized protein YuzE
LYPSERTDVKMALIRYDPEADVLAVKVREGALAEEELLDNDVILGCDKSGKLVSLEILDASKKGLRSAFVELAKSKKETTKLLLSKIS